LSSWYWFGHQQGWTTSARGASSLRCLPSPDYHKKPGTTEEEQALKIILESPQHVKAAIPKIDRQLGKKVSRDWVKRLLKKRLSLAERP
jgi:hypothetical protein